MHNHARPPFLTRVGNFIRGCCQALYQRLFNREVPLTASPNADNQLGRDAAIVVVGFAGVATAIVSPTASSAIEAAGSANMVRQGVTDLVEDVSHVMQGFDIMHSTSTRTLPITPNSPETPPRLTPTISEGRGR